MPKFGRRSKERLDTSEEDLQKLFNEVIKHIDCSVLSGHRSKDEQNELVRKGASRLHFPKSRHNSLPSQAVDVVPYPIDWNDIERFKAFMNFVKGVAATMDIEIECGGDWKSFKDYPHFELRRK